MRILLLAKILLLGMLLRAQENDSLYVDRLDDKLFIAPYYSTRNFAMNLVRLNPGLKSSSFKPNVSNIVGVDFTFKSLFLSLSLPLPQSSERYELFGKSSYTSFSGQFTGDNYIIEGLTRYIRGFTTSNELSTTPPVIKRGDIDFFQLKGNYIHIYNADKYSYIAAFQFTERNRHSTGSFLFVGSLDYNIISADSAFMKNKEPLIDNEEAKLIKTSMFGMGIQWGYAHTFVFKKWYFLSLTGFAGFETRLNRNSFEGGLSPNTSLNISSNNEIRALVGFNGTRFFGGIGYTGDFNLVFQNDYLWMRSYSSLTLCLGYRINAPLPITKIEKRYDNLQKKVEKQIDNIIPDKKDKK